MTDNPTKDREYRRDPRFGKRYPPGGPFVCRIDDESRSFTIIGRSSSPSLVCCGRAAKTGPVEIKGRGKHEEFAVRSDGPRGSGDWGEQGPGQGHVAGLRGSRRECGDL